MFLVMSLFIGAITMAMFTAFEGMKMAQMKKEYEENLDTNAEEIFNEGGDLANKIIAIPFHP